MVYMLLMKQYLVLTVCQQQMRFDSMRYVKSRIGALEETCCEYCERTIEYGESILVDMEGLLNPLCVDCEGVEVTA